MDIRRLEAFCKVYELRSFSKAGQELFLSQPTISAHISSLESELGISLFDRLGRSILPTQAGITLYAHAKDVFDSLARGKAAVEQLLDKVCGELVIGASTIPANYIVPQLLKSFLLVYPDVQFSLLEGDTSEITKKVHDGDLLCGIVGAKPLSDELSSLELQEDDLVFIAPPGFQLVQGNSLRDNILSWKWIIREPGSGTRLAFERGIANLGLTLPDLKVVAQVPSNHSALQFVRSGLGVSITSRLAAEAMSARNEIAVVSLADFSAHRSFWFIWNERRTFLPAATHFLNFLKSHQKR